MDRLSEIIFKLLLFMTAPWFFIYSRLKKDEAEDVDEIEEETYTITIGKIVYEFDTWEDVLRFVKTYDRNKK